MDANVQLPPLRRVKLVKRIRGARQPLREARQVVSEIVVGRSSTKHDFSDVQQLRVRLLRRDFWLDEYQGRKLRELDRRVARNDISEPEFEREATDLMLYVSPLPKSYREQERDFHLAPPERATTGCAA